MMKRGCRAIVHGDHEIKVLEAFDPSLRHVDDGNRDRYQKDILGNVLGTSLDTLNDVDVTRYTVPVYFPTIGMSDDEVSSMLRIIRSEI
jgi:thiamine biosynthesis protein ThiI